MHSEPYSIFCLSSLECDVAKNIVGTMRADAV
jgi:hypothetical protein